MPTPIGPFEEDMALYASFNTHTADLAAHTRDYFQEYRIGGLIEGYPNYDPLIQALVADQLYGTILNIRRAITISALAIEVTAFVDPSNIRLGLYNVGANFAIGTRLNNGAVVSGATNGVKTATFTQALAKGIYYIGFISDAGPSVRDARVQWNPLGRAAHAFSANYYAGWKVAGVGYGNLPDPFPTVGLVDIYGTAPIVCGVVASLD